MIQGRKVGKKEREGEDEEVEWKTNGNKKRKNDGRERDLEF